MSGRKVLLLDLESAPQGWRDVRADGPPWTAPLECVERAEAAAMTKPPPKNYKKPETIANWRSDEVEKAHEQAFADWSRQSFDPKYGEVVCVTAGFPGGKRWDMGIVNGVVLPERSTLGMLLDLLYDEQPDVIVAHAGETFDFPFLWVRGALSGLPKLSRWFSGAIYYRDRVNASVPTTIAVEEPHSDGPVMIDRPRLVDSLRLWPGERGSGRGLIELSTVLGVEERLEDPLSGGGEVLTALLEGRADDVLAHGVADIERLDGLWGVLVAALGLS